MKHRITEEEWFACLDSPASALTGLKIERHLQTCASCRETLAGMRALDRALTSTAADLRATVMVDSAAVAAAKAKALAGMGDASLSIRLGSLYLLLAPMCGVETSTRAICAAAHRASLCSPRLLDERLWPGFVNHLHDIVAAICGEPAAELVLERGLRLPREAA